MGSFYLAGNRSSYRVVRQYFVGGAYGFWIHNESENLQEPIAYAISVDTSVYSAYVFSLSFFLW